MKVLFINGSPKSDNSSSELLINALHKLLGNLNEYITITAMKASKQAFLDGVRGADVAVIVFPLYVDGIPSHLLRLLCEVKDELKNINPNVVLYAIANNGFYEGTQNALALNMIQHFCDAAGIRWGQGLGIGAGGMLNSSPIGIAVLKNIGIALETLAENINKQISGDDLFAQPNFPKFLYKTAAHFNWIQSAKKNGLKRNDIYKKH
ncbi:MAG: NAD(P)H-dependent oxidoreductase [Defluviitaleaceae bacterium]|nr:NAD(P)H-dependent oxidoreductase [Defluviitaleaceae bacterium]